MRASRVTRATCASPADTAMCSATPIGDCHADRRPTRRDHAQHAGRAAGQVQLQRQPLFGTGREGFGAHAHQAAAQSARQRAQRLPFQPVAGVARGVGLRDGGAAQLAAGVLVVALRAGQVELAHALGPQALAQGQPGFQAGVLRRVQCGGQRQAARGLGQKGGQGQHLGAIGALQCRPLVALAALVAAAGQRDGARAALVPRRVAGGHGGHAGGRVAAGAGRATGGGLGPQRFAVLHPQLGGVLRVVALQGLQGGAHEVDAAAALGLGLAGWCQQGQCTESGCSPTFQISCHPHQPPAMSSATVSVW